MTTLGNERKLAAVSRETPENKGNSQSKKTLNPEMAEEYITQVCEEIKRRVTKELSQEFSLTETCILVAFCKINAFLLNPQVRTCSVAVPETCRNINSEKTH